MKNDNGNIFRPDLELFNGGSWGGGRMGGRSLYTIPWISWIYLILGKKTHFQGYRRGDYGGAGGGGAIFAIHGGVQGGRWVHIWSIFYLKKRDFFISVFVWVWKVGAPPSVPPWIDFRNIKIWYVTTNQNKKSLIFDHYSCFYNFKHAHIRFLAIFEEKR